MEQVTLCEPEESDPPIPEGGCVNYNTCQNMTPGGTNSNNRMCDSCLDECRQEDR